MTDHAIRKVVIAGGGTAGWVVAAALSSQLGKLLEIVLVESDQIGTVGVGEATIPTHCAFHRYIGVNEQDFMRATQATFKLGIRFENWGQVGEDYFHAFGSIGKSSWVGSFESIWRAAGGEAGALDDYCLELKAAEAGKFGLGSKPALNYAYHLDASLYSQFLRKLSEQRGVRRVEGKISNVERDGETGELSALGLEDGTRIEGDFFVDCTGFRGLLIDKALGVGFEDWAHWLPMNSAWAVQTKSTEPPVPYTRSIAREAGWQWRIPLQHRTGNGLVYCDDYIDDEAARAQLEASLNGEMITTPRNIKFRTGRRKLPWSKNCLAVGLSSGFMEPLESTSIHLIQIAATRLVQMFPFDGINDAVASHYNRYMNEEVESIRDFLVLHYKVTQRSDSPFWRDRQAMDIPDSLAQRLELYRNSGILYQDGSDLFRTDSWVQVMHGQGLRSPAYHRFGHMMETENLESALRDMRGQISQTVAALPAHADFLRQYCATQDYP
ncbi:tryptophan halogenase family protein [Henriciella sp. AS95]|uniref:tryptophan halogenase family protein n=1 Tax=Henriciella sp. AS95 TaxID=3135782 RepID=UPI00317ADE9A